MLDFKFFYYILGIISLLLTFILIYLIRTDNSIYSQLMYRITITEGIFVYSQLILANSLYFNKKISLIFIDLPTNLFFVSNFYLYIIINSYTVLLNCFLSLEMFFTLRNPVSEKKSRVKKYTIIIIFYCLVQLILLFIYFPGLIKNEEFDEDKVFKEIKFITFMNILPYVFYFIIGIISVIVLIGRFCCGRFIIKNIKNCFVFRHILYLFIYIIIFSPSIFYLINLNFNLKLFENKENLKNLKTISIIFNLSIGIIMFFFRKPKIKKSSLSNKKIELDETTNIIEDNESENFFRNDQYISSAISSLMNLEFMCCILYGLSNIFEEIKKRKEEKLILIKKTINLTKNSNNLINNEETETKVKKKFDSIVSDSIKNLKPKDFTKMKNHKIKYEYLFDNEIDISQFKLQMNKKQYKNIIAVNSFSEAINEDNISYKSISVTSPYLKDGYDAEIIEYCPKVFKYLRRIDEIDDKICESLNPKNNVENINKIKESQGKSGSFFFFSYDNQFIIKTINKGELHTLINNLMENYYENIRENEQTLLAKLYGAYSIIIGGVSKIHIVLMQNINPLGFDNIYFKRYFDLKGSLQGRKTQNIRKAERGHAFKDLDFLNYQKMNDEIIDFNKEIINEVLYKLQSDLNILVKSNIMDYSLLFYIYEIPPQSSENDYNKVFNLFADERYKYKIFKSQKNKYLYILGIIDYLQSYNAKKFLENKYLYILHGKNIKNISAVEPEFYAKRMYNFAKENIFIQS